MSLSPRARQIGAWICFCALIVAARVTATGVSELAEAREREARGEEHEAAVHYGRALRMYLPGSPVPQKAAERLLALAQAAKQQGRTIDARYCFEELRSGLLATRSFYQPGRTFIEIAQEELLALILEAPDGTWPDPAKPASEREAVVRSSLEAREDPSLPWVLVMGGGWVLWLGAAVRAIFAGLPSAEDAPIHWSVLRKWALISAGGYALWVLGVAMA